MTVTTLRRRAVVLMALLAAAVPGDSAADEPAADGSSDEPATRGTTLEWLRCPERVGHDAALIARVRVYIGESDAASLTADKLLVVERNELEDALNKERAIHRRQRSSATSTGGFALASDGDRGGRLVTTTPRITVALDASGSMWPRSLRNGDSPWQRVLDRLGSEFAKVPDASVAVLPFSCTHASARQVEGLSYRSGSAALEDFARHKTRAGFREPWRGTYNGVPVAIDKPRDTQLFGTVVETLKGVVNRRSSASAAEVSNDVVMVFTDGEQDAGQCRGPRSPSCDDVVDAVEQACSKGVDVRLFVAAAPSRQCSAGESCPSLSECLRTRYAADGRELACEGTASSGDAPTCPMLCAAEEQRDESGVSKLLSAPNGYFDVFVRPYARVPDLDRARFEVRYGDGLLAETATAPIGAPFARRLGRGEVTDEVAAALCAVADPRYTPLFFWFPVLAFGLLTTVVLVRARGGGLPG